MSEALATRFEYSNEQTDLTVDPLTFHVQPVKEHLLHACQKMFQTPVKSFPIEMVYATMMIISPKLALDGPLGQALYRAMFNRLRFAFFWETEWGHATYLALALSQNVHVRYDTEFQPIKGCAELQTVIFKHFRLCDRSIVPKIWEVTFVLEDFNEKPAIGTFHTLRTLFSFIG